MKRILFLLFFFTISFIVFPQDRWQPYAGLHISGDAEMYYIGPSLQAGTDFKLKKRLLLSSYFHFFQKKVNHAKAGEFEKGRFNTITLAALIQVNTGIKPHQSFFLAGGICMQRWADKYLSNDVNWDKNRINLLPAIRIGYFFPVKKYKMSIELNATGPYSYQDETWSVLEIVTQLSLGTRFIF